MAVRSIDHLMNGILTRTVLGVVLALTFQSPGLGVEWMTPVTRESDFKAFVQDFEKNYAYMDQPAQPWLTWQQRYGTMAEEAKSEEAFTQSYPMQWLSCMISMPKCAHPFPIAGCRCRPLRTIWAEWHRDSAVVIAVRRGSDAERSGIHAGDHITQAGHQSILQAVTDRLAFTAQGADEKARNWALLSVLSGRADEARSFTVLSSTGISRLVTLPVQHQFDRPAGLLSDRTLAGNIGYIRFNNSLGEQPTVAAFDQALAKLEETRGLILDLRDVPSGGDSSIALGVMGRLVTSILPYQHHRIPNYGQSDVERNWLELVAPRGPFGYTKKIIVLVDHWTGSMGEGMAIGPDGMHRAVILGTPMAHLAGAVDDFHLPNSGVDVAFATEQLFHVNGTPRQDWLPPVLVAEPATANRDSMLDRALKEFAAPPATSPSFSH